MIYNVVLVSGVQQSDSVIHTHVSFFFSKMFPFRLLQNIEQNFSGGSVVKNLPAMQEMQVQSLGQEDPLEKCMATHSSILAWRIP